MRPPVAFLFLGDAAEDLTAHTDPGVAAATVAAFIGIVFVYLAAFWWLGPDCWPAPPRG